LANLGDKPADVNRAGDAGRPCESHGPGFLEIVSGPGPLNALYVSCNLIPRRSMRRCSRSDNNLREFLAIRVSVRPDLLGSFSRPMPPSSLGSRCRAASDPRRTVDGPRSPGRQCARTRHCLADSSVSKRDASRQRRRESANADLALFSISSLS